MLERLNKEQREVAEQVDGAILVISPAGSGKSNTLVTRVTHMLASDAMITPNMLLLLTFTESGVAVMRERLVKMIGATAYKININTFHGFANEIIQGHPDYFGIREFEPVSDLERIEIAYKILDEIPNNHVLKRLRGDVYYDSRRMLALFSVMKEESWDPQDVEDAANAYFNKLPENPDYIYKRANKKRGIEVGDIKQALITKEKDRMEILCGAAGLLPRYNQRLRMAERYDFSDMIHWVLKAWREDEDFLLNYQERYQYILTDESQDHNRSQFNLLEHLLDFWPDPNIMLIGDFNQSIYAFQGARIQNIVDFKNKYNPKIVSFNKNYRSSDKIIRHATNVINYNDDSMDGFEMSMVAATDKGEALPKVLEFDNLSIETCYIADSIEEIHNKGGDISSVGVIYRKHRQADDLIQQLEARGIPYKIKRSINVLDSIIVRQLLDVLSFIVNYDELRQNNYDSLLFRILHFSFLGNDHQKIHRYYMLLQDKEARSRKPVDYIKTEKMLDELVKLYHNVPLVILINHIIEDTGLLKWVVGSKDYLQQVQYINTFFYWVKAEAFKDLNLNGKELIQKIDKMRSNGLFLSVVDISGQNKGVNLMTAHGSKGLEFATVFVMGCTRNEWEGSRAGAMSYKLPDTLTLSSEENKIESNRRLFYVSMTRAERNLVITYAAHNNENKELEPSQFIIESEIDITREINIDLSDYLRYQFKKAEKEFLIDKSVIQERLDKFTMSVSSLNKYLECQTAFYYENIILVPFVSSAALIFGNGAHIALKHLYDYAKSGSNMGYAQFFAVFKKYLDRNKGQLLKKESADRLELGKRTLTNYYNEVYPYANKVTLNEFKFNRIVVDGIPMKGDADKLEFDGRWVDVVDYKTGSITYAKKNLKPPSEKEPNGGSYWKQAGFYKILLDNFHNKDWSFRSVRFDMLGDGEFESLPVEIKIEDEIMLKKLIVETYHKIMDGQFTDGCGKPECKWCNLVS